MRMRVIVGVDRSDASRAALRVAMREAATHSAELIVIHAFPPVFAHLYATEAVHVLRASALADADALLEDVLAHARAELRAPSIARITTLPIEGDAAAVLTEIARQDDVLIVGGKRVRRLRRVLYGSTTTRVIQSASSAVIVVPAPRRVERQAADLRAVPA